MTMSDLRHRILVQEMEEKIKLLRMNWFVANHEQRQHRVADTAAANPQTKPDSTRESRLVAEVRAMRAEIKAINVALERQRLELEERAEAKGGGRDETADRPAEADFSCMYPVPREVQLQLYTGVSSNEEGRYRYLKTRNKLSPDEKYRVCPTHSYKHGWNIKKSQQQAGSKHGRKRVLTGAMYSVHGITLYDEHPTHRPAYCS